MFRKWNPSELQQCARLIDQGLTNIEISQELGRVEADVSEQRKKIYLAKVKGFWKKAQDEKLKELWLLKTPTEEIVRILGRSRESILGRAHRLGLQRRSLRSGRKKGIPYKKPNVTISKPQSSDPCILYSKPIRVAEQSIQRTCLRCKESFRVNSPFLRLCYPCRQLAEMDTGYFCFSHPRRQA